MIIFHFTSQTDILSVQPIHSNLTQFLKCNKPQYSLHSTIPVFLALAILHSITYILHAAMLPIFHTLYYQETYYVLYSPTITTCVLTAPVSNFFVNTLLSMHLICLYPYTFHTYNNATYIPTSPQHMYLLYFMCLHISMQSAYDISLTIINMFLIPSC